MLDEGGRARDNIIAAFSESNNEMTRNEFDDCFNGRRPKYIAFAPIWFGGCGGAWERGQQWHLHNLQLMISEGLVDAVDGVYTLINGSCVELCEVK